MFLRASANRVFLVAFGLSGAAATSTDAFAKPSTGPVTKNVEPAKAPIVPFTSVRPTSYDIRLKIDADGSAIAEHVLAVRISGGSLRALELKATDQNALPIGEPAMQSEDGRRVAASLAVREDGAIRLESGEDKGWKRGAYTVRFAMKTDLTKSGALKRDGVLYRIAWASPTMGDGIDGMRVIFDLPAAPTEPRALSFRAGDARAEEEGGLLSTLRRSAARDELEMVRPHVGRGELVVWDARVDPRAIPAVRSPALAPKPLVVPPPPPNRNVPFGVAFGVGLFVFLLAFAKERSRPQTSWSALVPLPPFVRMVVASAAAGGASLAFIDTKTITGFGAVALSCVCLARAPRGREAKRRKARGPGEWLALRTDEAFANLPSGWLSMTNWRGRLAFVIALSAVAGAVFAASLVDVRIPASIALIGAVLPALWWGEALSGIDVSRALLARAYKRLSKRDGLRVVPWARIPKGGMSFEEVRLRVLPKHPIPGLLALEMGTAGEAVEVLVRVRDESPAARRLAACAKLVPSAALRTLPGRTADERVLSLEPTSPSLTAACRLAESLSEVLVDRRDPEVIVYEGAERRGAALAAA